jgi:hypothetical protein
MFPNRSKRALVDFLLQTLLRKPLPLLDSVFQLCRLLIVLLCINSASSSTGTCQFFLGFCVSSDELAGAGGAAGGGALLVGRESFLDVDVEEELIWGGELAGESGVRREVNT